MISSELQALIRQLEITTRKQVSGPLLGDSRTALKGSGFEFHQLRDYTPGDDIRFIDWKASARLSKILVREYLEERNRTVYIVADVSASTEFGTAHEGDIPLVKADLIKQLGTVLAFSALHTNDSVGLILFSDKIEVTIPPRRSRNHVLRLAKELYTHRALRRATDLNVPLNYIARLKGQKSIVCLISDFLAPLDEKTLSIASRRHDLLAFRCLDQREKQFPEVGTLMVKDRETLIQAPIAGSGRIDHTLKRWHQHQKECLTSARIDSLDCEVGMSFTGPLLQFLRQRVY